MSSLKDLASLIMIPSLYKDGELHTVKPLADENIIVHPDATDNNDGVDGTTPSTSSNFTFSRGSNLAATRVASSGYIEKGRENLLLQSNQFDTTWTTAYAVTSGQSGYDGTSDAWKFEATTTAATNLAQSVAIGANIPTTLSVYAKSGNVDFLKFIIACSGPNSIVTFDLSDGSTSNNSRNISVNAEDVGGGWYRLSATAAPGTDITQARFELRSAVNSSSTDAGSYIFVQDAQFELGLVATSVIETTTTSVSAGILEDMPRLDYSGSCPSLLLEPQRTNLFPHSEYIKGNALYNSPIITENYAVSPEGLSNAFRIQDTTGTSFRQVRPASSSLSVSANSTYTQSLFVKKATSAVTNYGGINFDYTGGTTRKISYVIFDEYNGTLAELPSSFPLSATLHPVEDYGDYWRFSVSATDDGGNTNLNMSVYACLSSNGTSTSTGIKDWTGYGLQLEQGSYPTSYIPTYGTSQTRSLDNVNELTGVSDLIGQSEGTLFLDFVANDDDALQIIYQVRTTGSTNVGQIDFRIQSGNIRALGNDAGTTQFNISAGAAVAGTRYKCAVRYANNDVAFYVNGVLKGSDTNASFSSSALQQISFSENTGTFFPSASIKQALVFPTGLTNTELASLTTL